MQGVKTTLIAEVIINSNVKNLNKTFDQNNFLQKQKYYQALYKIPDNDFEYLVYNYNIIFHQYI